MIKGLTQAHLRAFNYKTQTAEGLLLRAEYCDFMAQSSPMSAYGRSLWELSASRRRDEAAKRSQGQ